MESPTQNDPTEAKPTHHAPGVAKTGYYEHFIRLNRVRQQKLIQVAHKRGMSPHDLIVKVLDAYLAADIQYPRWSGRRPSRAQKPG